jgi:hypothetical protein
MQNTAPNYPSIISPNGGETYLTNEITISWNAPNPLGADHPRSFDYEIYYTDQFNPLKEPDWQQIAVVPSHVESFVWRYGNNIRSETCRIAIRARNSRGERSKWSISAANFSIRRKKIDPPTVISPMDNERYDKVIQILLDNSGIIGTYSERSFYQFYYSSVEAGIPLTPIAQNVPIETKTIQWQTISLAPAKDYIIQGFLADDVGNVSDSIFIKNIEIAHEGFFLIDTKPPESAIIINNNATFTKERDVTITVVSYDKTTAVHSMQFQDESNKSLPEPISDVAHYTLSEGDAIKKVELLLQDYGANRNDSETQRLFETIVEDDNGTAIADIAIDKDTSTAWAIVSSPLNYLYKIKQFPSLVTAFEDEPTSVSVFNSFAYVGVKTSDSLGILMKYNGYEAVVVKEFTEADSIINTMTTHDGKLYMGFENGSVYRFDGLTFQKLNGVNNPVKSLVSDGNLLYLTERNSTEIYVFNGTEFVSTGAE